MQTSTSGEADRWLSAGKQALLSGSLASAFSTVVLAWHGQQRYASPAAPTNATSHWLWGDQEAFNADDLDWRHTAVGFATHHASAVMWALFYERWLNRKVNPSSLEIVRDAALMTGVAAFVDYTLTPKRLTPGFESRLTRPGLIGVFAAFGVGLALGGFLNRQHERRLEQLRQLPPDEAPAIPSM